MPLPPLAASERRLATVAAVSAWVCALSGVAVAALPQLVLRGLLLGGHGPAALATRLFAALAGAGLIGTAASLRRTALSPRDERRGFAPLLWLLSVSAVSLGLAARHGDAMGLSARPVATLAVAALLGYAALALIYFRAAPGVNLGAAVAPPAEAAPKAVQLGVRVAPAPEPLPEQKAAAGASRA